MSILKNLFVLLFLLSSSAAVYAAVEDIHSGSCSIFSQADDDAKEKGTEEKDKEAEEEPDCE